MVKVTRAIHSDLNKITDVDLKCFDYPWVAFVFGEFLKGRKSELLVASHRGKIVGYLAGLAEDAEAKIGRIGVLKKYRRHGVGGQLLEEFIKISRGRKCEKLSIMVPSLYCTPGDPDDCSQWLLGTGFLAARVKSDAYVMFGDDVDGYIFERNL